MPEREVRYCTSADGTRIAYCLQGEGPVLVALPQFVDSFSLDHLHSTRTPFFDALARNRTLVRYDLRGTGLSQRPATDFSLDAVTADLAAVVASLSALPDSDKEMMSRPDAKESQREGFREVVRQVHEVPWTASP